MMEPRVIDAVDCRPEVFPAIDTGDEAGVPHPDSLGELLADLNRRAKQELEQLDLRVALLRRVVNITDSALHADDQPQQASSEPFGCSF